MHNALTIKVYKIGWHSRTYLKSQQNQRNILFAAGCPNLSNYSKRSQRSGEVENKTATLLKSKDKLNKKTRCTAHHFLFYYEGTNDAGDSPPPGIGERKGGKPVLSFRKTRSHPDLERGGSVFHRTNTFGFSSGHQLLGQIFQSYW